MRTPGFLVCTALVAAAPVPSAAQPDRAAAIEVTVLDPSGAVVTTASMTLAIEDGSRPARTVAPPDAPLVASGLAPGRYTIRIEAPGFVPLVLEHVALDGAHQRTVRLRLAPVSETVVVERDPQTAALDPRGFSTVLTREQIDALPDDPEEFARALQHLAPPGAVIRIDGFTGGPLPPKSQILSIRLPRMDTYAAQDHGGLTGLSFIDIVTTPGRGRLQGSADVSMRHHALNARNPLSSSRGPESTLAGTIALDGPLVAGRASFAAALRAGRESDATTIRAVMPDGSLVAEPVSRPREWMTASGRITLAAGGGHTIRVSLSSDRRLSRNVGVGDVNLPDRAYRTEASDAAIRISTGGPLGRRGFIDSRLQMAWDGRRSTSAVERPTVRVLEAFAAGGAQVAGGARSSAITAATDADYVRGVHAWRFGGLLEAERRQANRRANYLGTYTFTSLDAYLDGRPASYTRRLGDAGVRYSNVQVGLYAQDDYRAARSLLLSYGVRYERQALTGGVGRLLPRAGLTWSPFRSGRTTIRAGGGLFSEWVPSGVHEQALTLDGTRQYDVHVPQPTYPDPPATGQALVPRDRYLLDAALRLPSSAAAGAGIEQQVGGLRVYATYTRRTGWRLLRGHNLNAPVDAVRPDPASGNVVQTRSDARLEGHGVTVQVATANTASRASFVAAYLFDDTRSNTAGAFALPAGAGASEWGPMTIAHAFTGTVVLRATSHLTITLLPQWRSGLPYTITTGRDDNGDGLFIDRPPGMARNAARTPPQWEVGARVSFALGFGRRTSPEPRLPSAGADVESARAGSVLNVAPSAGGRYRVEVFASAQNVTNRPNYLGVGSIVGSPFFGQPTVALNPRRLELGVRLGF